MSSEPGRAVSVVEKRTAASRVIKVSFILYLIFRVGLYWEISQDYLFFVLCVHADGHGSVVEQANFHVGTENACANALAKSA